MLLVAALNMKGRGGHRFLSRAAYTAVHDTVSPMIAVFFAIGLLVFRGVGVGIGGRILPGAMIMQGLLYRSISDVGCGGLVTLGARPC